MFIRPAQGRKVRRPHTLTPLPESGAEVVAEAYWHRRIAHGDVEVITPEEAATKPDGAERPAEA